MAPPTLCYICIQLVRPAVSGTPAAVCLLLAHHLLRPAYNFNDSSLTQNWLDSRLGNNLYWALASVLGSTASVLTLVSEVTASALASNCGASALVSVSGTSVLVTTPGLAASEPGF